MFGFLSTVYTGLQNMCFASGLNCNFGTLLKKLYVKSFFVVQNFNIALNKVILKKLSESISSITNRNDFARYYEVDSAGLFVSFQNLNLSHNEAFGIK